MSAMFVIYWKSSLTGHIGNGEPVRLEEAQEWVFFAALKLKMSTKK
jgi:hypothetical protein